MIKTSTFVEVKNPTTLEKILTSPQNKSLALSFLNAFVGLDIKDMTVNAYPKAPFVIKGAFSDAIEIILHDASNVRHLIHFNFLEMQLGLSQADISFYKTTWLQLKQDSENESFRYFNCHNIQQIYFFDFNISDDSAYKTVKSYNFEDPDFTLQFKCFELLKFDKTPHDFNTERDNWLYLFKHGTEAVFQLPSSNFKNYLINALDLQNWEAHDVKTYEQRAQHRDERPQKTLNYYLENNVSLDKNFMETPAKNCTFNWLLLEFQLTLLPKNKVQAEELDISPLQADLAKNVFTLFRQWTTNCKNKHPDLDLTIITEQVLIQDLENALRKSIIALFNNETFYKQKQSLSFAQSFVLGHIEGKLGIHWYTEYIIKTKKEYKTMMALKAVSNYLTSEDIMRLEIEEIYEEMLKTTVNLSNISVEVPKISLKKGDGISSENDDEQSNVQTVLNNLAHEYSLKMQSIRVENFEIEVSKVIEKEALKACILLNWGLF
jgi:hypothetical protein